MHRLVRNANKLCGSWRVIILQLHKTLCISRMFSLLAAVFFAFDPSQMVRLRIIIKIS